MKRVIQWLLAFTITILFCISGQTAEVCSHDCEDAGIEQAEEHLHDETTRHIESAESTDCDCTSHAHSCCSHFSVVMVRPTGVVQKTEFDDVASAIYLLAFLPDPCLEGPFQPPKA